MSEYIECRSCTSPSCKGCNIYALATMLRRGAFDGLMNGNRSIIPAADVVEVKHGEWIKSKWGYPDRTLTCSHCGFEYDSADYNHPKLKQKLLPYCPNCGAKMDKEGG